MTIVQADRPGQPERRLQPLLHDLAAVVHAPTSVLSGHDGQITGYGVQGVFYADCRALSEAVLRVGGREPEPVMDALEGAHGARFVGLARHLGDAGADPTVRVDRFRRVLADGLVEEIRVSSTAARPVPLAVDLSLASDLAPMSEVRTGGSGTPRPARVGDGTLAWSTAGTSVRVDGAGVGVDGADGTGGHRARASGAGLHWSFELAPGTTVTLRWRLRVTTTAAAVAAASGPVEWSRPVLVADDRRLVRLLDRSLDDLAALRVSEPPGRGEPPGDTFLAAGVPWFLTLFGRDSIWAARMLLPLGTELAAGTLRVLARRQGRRVDDVSGEAPGKIMHELRYGGLFGLDGMDRAVAYYGTVDATPLWISLLHDAWRWGLPAGQVEPLLPALRAALHWLEHDADPDGDGFLEYLDRGGHGLANQGWKDSSDAVRFRDGRLASPPIALCEVQGYAYQAAVHGAALLDAFGEPGADRWRQYAADLAELFRARYWVDGPDGPYPALALDRDKRPVDALTSNIGHLLGTGLLNEAESALVADRLASPAMSGGYGLRTMSARDGGYRPLSYHCGSVWPHDTAIVLSGLARCGFGAAAAGLAEGLLAAAEAFGYRLPEVYGGDGRDEVGRPVPYPAACRPQAWSAAAAVAVLAAALGLEPDVPAGRLRLRPLPGAPLGALRAAGLRIAGTPVEVSVAPGGVRVAGLPEGIALVGPAVRIPAQRAEGAAAPPAGTGHADPAGRP